MAAKMSKRDMKIKFKNGNMRLATCVEEDAAKIKEAITNKNWANAFQAFAQGDNIVQSRSRLAFLLAAWTVQTIWSWIFISDVEKDNVLELEFEKKKQSDFNPEEMKKEIANALKDLDDVLEDILTDDPEGCKAKIKDILKKVTVDDVEIVGETKKSICAGTILENVKNVKDNEENVKKIILGKPGTKTSGTFVKDSNNILLKHKDGTEQVRGATNSETALHKIERCKNVTEKKTNVHTRIKGAGSNSTTAGSIVDKTENFTSESRDGSLTVDGRNAGDTGGERETCTYGLYITDSNEVSLKQDGGSQHVTGGRGRSAAAIKVKRGKNITVDEDKVTKTIHGGGPGSKASAIDIERAKNVSLKYDGNKVKVTGGTGESSTSEMKVTDSTGVSIEKRGMQDELIGNGGRVSNINLENTTNADVTVQNGSVFTSGTGTKSCVEVERKCQINSITVSNVTMVDTNP